MIGNYEMCTAKQRQFSQPDVPTFGIQFKQVVKFGKKLNLT